MFCPRVLQEILPSHCQRLWRTFTRKPYQCYLLLGLVPSFLVWLLIFVSHRCKSTTVCAEFTTVQQSLITRTMYCFSYNTIDYMQENDIIINQDWRCLLLNVVHWNIYGKIFSIREERNIAEASYFVFILSNKFLY